MGLEKEIDFRKINRQTILVKRNEGLGDVMMTTAVLSQVRKENPDSYIIFQTSYPELLFLNKDIDLVIPPTINAQAERIIDLNWMVEAVGIGEGKISFVDYATHNRMDLFSHAAGVNGNSQMQYQFLADEIEQAENTWATLEGEKRILVCFFCASAIRSYFYPNVISILKELIEKNYSVIMIGTDPERIWPDRPATNEFVNALAKLTNKNSDKILNLMEKTKLREAAALIKKSDLVLTIDTGILHLAAAMGSKTVALFGNIDPDLRTKYYPNCRAMFTKSFPCVPCQDFSPFQDGIVDCMRNQDRKLFKFRSEEQISAPCMRNLRPEKVMAEIDNFLNTKTLETNRERDRRLRENFFNKYCQGKGIDIGYGGDLLCENCMGWDKEDGDAQFMSEVEDEKFDFVYSSHCLEHIPNVELALENWWRILKPGGHLILLLPERDLYEQKETLPSVRNPDHKHFFFLEKDEPPDTIGILPLIKKLFQNGEVIQSHLCTERGAYSIELVIKKVEEKLTNGNTKSD